MTLCNIYRTPFLSPRCSRCNGAPQFSPTWRSIRFRIYAKAERCSRWEWVSLSQSGGFWEPSCTRAVLKREREKERKKEIREIWRRDRREVVVVVVVAKTNPSGPPKSLSSSSSSSWTLRDDDPLSRERKDRTVYFPERITTCKRLLMPSCAFFDDTLADIIISCSSISLFYHTTLRLLKQWRRENVFFLCGVYT